MLKMLARMLGVSYQETHHTSSANKKDINSYNNKLTSAKSNLDRAIAKFDTIVGDCAEDINHNEKIIEDLDQKNQEIREVKESAENIVGKYKDLTI